MTTENCPQRGEESAEEARTSAGWQQGWESRAAGLRACGCTRTRNAGTRPAEGSIAHGAFIECDYLHNCIAPLCSHALSRASCLHVTPYARAHAVSVPASRLLLRTRESRRSRRKRTGRSTLQHA